MMRKIDMIKNLKIYAINLVEVLKELEAGVWNNKILIFSLSFALVKEVPAMEAYQKKIKCSQVCMTEPVQMGE